MFIIPARGEVVRVSGSAVVAQDPELLESMTVNSRVPSFAIIVRVEEAMFHCSKAMKRSNMWAPEKWASIEGLSTYGQALVDHGKLEITAEEFQPRLDQHAKETLY